VALLSFVGFGTPTLQAHGEQRGSSFFNGRRDNPTAKDRVPERRRRTAMGFSKNHTRHFHQAVATGFLAFSVLGSAQAEDTAEADRIWTTVGSTGTLDKTDAAKVAFSNSAVQLGMVLAAPQSTANRDVADVQKRATVFSHPESAVVRYNVTPVDGLFKLIVDRAAYGVELKLRYLAVNAQVVAKFIEVDLATGEEGVYLTFNSNQFQARTDYHVEAVRECGLGIPALPFDFKNKAYYIEATLTHVPLYLGSAAGIQIIKLISLNDQNSCNGFGGN
jgi:hypothetical protein